MGDHGVMDSANIFLVIIIVIIVVTIAAALLAFICTQILPDIGEKLNINLLTFF